MNAPFPPRHTPENDAPECPDKACAATGPEGCRYPNWMMCGHPVERPARSVIPPEVTE